MAIDDELREEIPHLMGRLGITAVIAGAIHGYYDAKGIPFSNETLHHAMIYMPALIQSGILATTGAATELIQPNETGKKEYLRKTASTLFFAELYGTIALSAGIIETVFGYAVGHMIGKM